MTRKRRLPNINARRLGVYLMKTREIVELSYEQAAERIGCEVDWLIRVETGFESPSPEKVRHMLESYQVIGAKAAEMMIDLSYRSAGPPWIERHGEQLRPEERDALICEAEASLVRSYRIRLIPDLARTEAYERMLASGRGFDLEPDAAWDLMDSRQRFRPGGRTRRLDMIIDQQALTLPVPDPEVMVEQLRHLLELSERPEVTIRTIPETAPIYEERGHHFDVLELSNSAERVSVDHTVLGASISPFDLLDIWQHIEKTSAMNPEDSRALIRSILTDLRAGLR